MIAWTVRVANADDAEAIVALVHRFNVADAFRALSFGAAPRTLPRLDKPHGQDRLAAAIARLVPAEPPSS